MGYSVGDIPGSSVVKSTVVSPVSAAKDSGGVLTGNEDVGDYAAGVDTQKKKQQDADAQQAALNQQATQSRTGTMEQIGGISDTAYAAQQKRLSDYQGGVSADNSLADAADNSYRNTITAAETENQNNTANLARQAASQASSANSTYTNSIAPSFKNAMEQADTNASQAMSLKDAGDMNNSVQQGVRNFFNNQAANQGKSGMADVGMLQSLGAQANAQQMGAGAPMTGSQMQLMQSGNAQQAGQAFQNVQQRMNNLRQQGIEQGISQSAAQYTRGQAAGETAANRRGEYMGAEGSQAVRTANQRGEQAGYNNAITGSKEKAGSATYGAAQSNIQRNLAQKGQFYNQDTGLAQQRTQDQAQRAMMQQDINLGQLSDQRMQAYATMQQANAEAQSRNALLGGAIQGVATGAGAYFGGPAGASAGSAAGSGVAQGLNSPGYQQAPPSQYQGVGQQQQTRYG